MLKHRRSWKMNVWVKGQQGEVASMVLWRHVGCLEGPWKGRMDAQRAHAWVPSGLGPACIQGHLLNPPIYTPSVCILSSSSSFTWKNLSCLILKWWFWVRIKSWGKWAHTLLIWLSKNLREIWHQLCFPFQEFVLSDILTSDNDQNLPFFNFC